MVAVEVIRCNIAHPLGKISYSKLHEGLINKAPPDYYFEFLVRLLNHIENNVIGLKVFIYGNEIHELAISAEGCEPPKKCLPTSHQNRMHHLVRFFSSKLPLEFFIHKSQELEVIF